MNFNQTVPKCSPYIFLHQESSNIRSLTKVLFYMDTCVEITWPAEYHLFYLGNSPVIGHFHLWNKWTVTANRLTASATENDYFCYKFSTMLAIHKLETWNKWSTLPHFHLHIYIIIFVFVCDFVSTSVYGKSATYAAPWTRELPHLTHPHF